MTIDLGVRQTEPTLSTRLLLGSRDGLGTQALVQSATLSLQMAGGGSSPLAQFPNLLILFWALAQSVILVRRASAATG